MVLETSVKMRSKSSKHGIRKNLQGNKELKHQVLLVKDAWSALILTKESVHLNKGKT